MAKKVILKDDNIEIMPITRGELVLDSSGQLAFHSSQFLATQSLPGLMSAADKTKLDNTQSAVVDTALSTTSTNAVLNKVITTGINEAKTLANNALDAADDALDTANSAQSIANAIKASYLKSASVSGNLLTLTDLDDEETKFNNTTYTFESGSNGSFTVTPVGGKAQTVTVGGVLTDDKVKQTNTTSSGSYRLLFSYTADNTTRTEGARKSSKLLFNPETGALTATSFSGNLAWSSLTGVPETFAPSAHNHPTSQINALTSYTKATAAAALATTDSLNAALGKLEYKLDVAYDLVTKANDSDGTIENLKEILDVLAGIKDTETIQALVGKYLPLAGGTMNNGAIVKFNNTGGLIQTSSTTNNAVSFLLWYKGSAKDANYSYAAQIGWHNTGNTDGAIYLVPNPQNTEPWGGSVGLYIGKTLFKWNNKTILHSGNYTSYTPILNSSSTHATSSSVIYAPSTAGTKGLILTSNGSGAPVWSSSVGTANNGVFYIEGTGTTAGTWLGSHTGIVSYYTGLTIAYKIPVAGAATTTLNINSLGAVTCYINTSKLTTHYGVGATAILVYDGTYFRAANYIDLTKFYWANIPISTTSSEYTTPIFQKITTGTINSNSYSLFFSTNNTTLIRLTKSDNDYFASNLYALKRVSLGTLYNNESWEDLYFKHGCFFLTDTLKGPLWLGVKGNRDTFIEFFNNYDIDNYSYNSLGKLGFNASGVPQCEINYRSYNLLHSGNSSVSGGGSSWGSSITVKINGVSKTLTIPANPNVDTKVTLTITTTSNTSWRPILIGYSYSDADPFAPSTVTNTVYATHLMKIKPSTGALWANSTIAASGFVKASSSDSYVLLGGGGHKALSDFAMASAYVKKAGDTMTGRLTMTGEGIIVTTATTSNYRTCVEFYKGTAADTTYSYDAQIGWHNTGGDGTGSICILPYATSTLPWGGSVGLFITKTDLKYNGASVWHSKNDGSGSGLDADLLDGKHASAFALASHGVHWEGFTKRANSNASWGTLIASNGYTPLFWLDSNNNGGVAFSDYSGQTFMQIDGYFYQNEGKNRVTDITETVTALGTSGNYLTWTKNGTTNNITIPYASSAGALGNYSIQHFMTYDNGNSSYLAASFTNENFSKKAAEKYIEYWDSTGGWFNSRWGLVLAISGFHRVGSSDSYVLLGGGGHKLESNLSVNYAASAGSASSCTGNAKGLSSSGYGKSNLTYYQTDGNFFGNSGWSHYIIANHGDGSSYYNFTIGLPFWGVPIYKRLEGGTADGWHTFITSENISSLSVSYASSAGAVAWGSITGKPSTFTPSTHYHNYFPENTAVYFRDPNNASWRGGMYWGSAGNEALCFAVVNANTSFRFFTGSDLANWTSSTWQGTPAFEVNKNGAYAPHFYENSDAKLKENIQAILDRDNIPQIKEFDWKESGKHSYGLIAQELEELGYSELVSTKDDGYKTVNYSAALSLIVGKLQVKIKELEKEIEILKNKN